MPSARPPMTGSVKVVPATSSMQRDIKNIKETGKVLSRKEGTSAKIGALVEERFNRANTKKVIPIRTGSGISGTSGKNVGKVFKPMGGGGLGGLLGSIKNR